MIHTPDMLDNLRRRVSERVSQKRFSHILGVERCAAYLGRLILPELTDELSAAALLHDVAKEIPMEIQLELISKNGFILTDEDRNTEGIIHAFTAPIIVMRDFKDFATKNILSAIMWHTVGKADMTVFEKIIFVSDYCEDTRKYDSCIKARKALFDNIEALSLQERLLRLDKACIMAIDGAIEALTKQSSPVNSRIYDTRKSLIKH